jgi:hypothetical protein
MRQAFQTFLALFGVIVIGISLAHLAIGPEAIIGGADVNPTSDGEDRFFAGVFLCLGIALLWCVRDVQHKRIYVNFIAAGFFIGGIGRLLALILVGTPHPFYVAMLVVELAVPPVMVFAANRVAEPADGVSSIAVRPVPQPGTFVTHVSLGPWRACAVFCRHGVERGHTGMGLWLRRVHPRPSRCDCHR